MDLSDVLRMSILEVGGVVVASICVIGLVSMTAAVFETER